MMSVAEASNSIDQAKHGGDDSSRAAQLQARENEQKALSLPAKPTTSMSTTATPGDGAGGSADGGCYAGTGTAAARP